MTEHRIVTGDPLDEDLVQGNNPRPANLDEYVGQPLLNQNLRVFVELGVRDVRKLPRICDPSLADDRVQQRSPPLRSVLVVDDRASKFLLSIHELDDIGSL